VGEVGEVGEERRGGEKGDRWGEGGEVGREGKEVGVHGRRRVVSRRRDERLGTRGRCIHLQIQRILSMILYQKVDEKKWKEKEQQKEEKEKDKEKEKEKEREGGRKEKRKKKKEKEKMHLRSAGDIENSEDVAIRVAKEFKNRRHILRLIDNLHSFAIT